MTKLRHQLDPQPSPAIKRWVDVAGGFSVAAAPRSDVGAMLGGGVEGFAA
jgi:hypothetical protein